MGLSLEMDIIRAQWLQSVRPEIHRDLPPMMRGMVDDMKKYVLQGVGKTSAFGVFVIDTLLKIFGIRDDLERIALVFVVNVAQGPYLMHLPNPEFRFLAPYPCVPDMVRIEDMAQKTGTLLRNRIQGVESRYQAFVAVEIVVVELIKE